MKHKQFILEVLSIEELEGLIGRSLKEAIKNNPLSNPLDQTPLTRQEACDFLKVDSSTLHRWTQKGDINAYAICGKRFYKMDELLNSLIKVKTKNQSNGPL
tara:strand:- start:2109 stop:2411 length:303 start_codon:yes stop_codon:yes gene_type:complete